MEAGVVGVVVHIHLWEGNQTFVIKEARPFRVEESNWKRLQLLVISTQYYNNYSPCNINFVSVAMHGQCCIVIHKSPIKGRDLHVTNLLYSVLAFISFTNSCLYNYGVNSIILCIAAANFGRGKFS